MRTQYEKPAKILTHPHFPPLELRISLRPALFGRHIGSNHPLNNFWHADCIERGVVKSRPGSIHDCLEGHSISGRVVRVPREHSWKEKRGQTR